LVPTKDVITMNNGCAAEVGGFRAGLELLENPDDLGFAEA